MNRAINRRFDFYPNRAINRRFDFFRTVTRPEFVQECKYCILCNTGWPISSLTLLLLLAVLNCSFKTLSAIHHLNCMLVLFTLAKFHFSRSNSLAVVTLKVRRGQKLLSWRHYFVLLNLWNQIDLNSNKVYIHVLQGYTKNFKSISLPLQELLGF